MQSVLQYNATVDKKKIKVIQPVITKEYETLELRILWKHGKTQFWSLLCPVFCISTCLLKSANKSVPAI